MEHYRINEMTKDAVIDALESSWKCGEDFHSFDTPLGKMKIQKLSYPKTKINVQFPNNPNEYAIRELKDIKQTQKRLANFIVREYEHLSWTYPKQTIPLEYSGDDPKTLEETCAYLQRLYFNPNPTIQEKNFILNRFADLMHNLLFEYAQILGLKYKSLCLRQFRKDCFTFGTPIPSGTLAYYSGGSVSVNARALFCHPNEIKGTLVHELCHTHIGNHGLQFVLAMENALIQLNLLDRPCVYASEYSSTNHNPLFPNISPYILDYQEILAGEDFFKGIKSVERKV